MSNPNYWVDGNIPWVSPKDMKRSHLWDAIDHVTEKALGHGTRLAPAQALFIVVRGMILAHTFPVAKAERPLAFNQDIKALIPRADVDSEFLLWWLTAHEQQLLGITTESTHGTKRMPTDALQKVEINLPPLPEQKAIAEVLSDVDALIASLDRLIAKKRDLKQAVMHQLLTGETRLPGFSGAWHDTTLGEIGDCIIGLTYAPQDVAESGLLVLRSSNIQGYQLSFHDNVYVSVPVAEKLMTRPGDILICVRNGSRSLIGKCALIDERSANLTFGAFMAVFRTRYWPFVFHAFQSAHIQRQIRENVGATINQITNKDMRALRIALPPPAEQAAIAEVLCDLDAEINALEERRNKTRLIKQGMMQELLTGRTRLL